MIHPHGDAGAPNADLGVGQTPYISGIFHIGPFTCMQEGVATAKIEAMVKELRQDQARPRLPDHPRLLRRLAQRQHRRRDRGLPGTVLPKEGPAAQNHAAVGAPESRHPGGKSQAPNPKSQTNPNFQILMTKTRVPVLRGVTRSFGGSTRRSSRARLPPQSAIAVPAHGHRPRSCPGAAASTCSLSPPCARS